MKSEFDQEMENERSKVFPFSIITRTCNDPQYLAGFSSVPASKDEAQTEFVQKYALISRNSSFVPVAKQPWDATQHLLNGKRSSLNDDVHESGDVRLLGRVENEKEGSREKGENHWCIKFFRPSLQYLAVGKREKGKES